MIDTDKLVSFLDWALKVNREYYAVTREPYVLGRIAVYRGLQNRVLDGEFDVREEK